MKNRLELPVVEKIIVGRAREKLGYVDQALAVPGRGLEGDRYFEGTGTFNRKELRQSGRELTMIGYEALQMCNARLQCDLDFVDLRRNLVISGIDFASIGRKPFWIGEVKLRINRTAPPCRYLSRLLGADMMAGLKGIGGMRVDILRTGTIRVGDRVRLYDDPQEGER